MAGDPLMIHDDPKQETNGSRDFQRSLRQILSPISHIRSIGLNTADTVRGRNTFLIVVFDI